MGRYVSLTGVLAAVAIVGFVGAVSVGLTIGSADGERAADADTTGTSQETEQQGIPVEEAAPGIGLRADISDCAVRLDGKPVEGKKILHVLGDTVFLNTHRIAGPDEKSYASKAIAEIYYLYGYHLAKGELEHRTSIMHIAQWLGKLPGVKKAPDPTTFSQVGNAYHVTFTSTAAPGASPSDILVSFNPAYASDRLKEARQSEKRRKAKKLFRRIVQDVDENRRIRLESRHIQVGCSKRQADE